MVAGGKHTEAFFKCVLSAFMGVFFGVRRNDAVYSVARLTVENWVVCFSFPTIRETAALKQNASSG